MEFLFIALCIILLIGAFYAFSRAFRRPQTPHGGGSINRTACLLKWAGTGITAVILAIMLFVFGFMPALVRNRLADAADIARKTFREKLGVEPDSLVFDNTNQRTTWEDGWKYVGVAKFGDIIWDVTVTNSNEHTGYGETTSTLHFEATPRRQ